MTQRNQFSWLALACVTLTLCALGEQKPVIDDQAFDRILEQAAAASDPCLKQHHLVRPYYPGQADSPTFDYYYALVRAAQPGHTTVIFLTGGPGQSAMDEAESRAAYYPKETGVVMLDPRGIGCNRPRHGRAFPLDFYSTENIAQDTLAVVRDLKLQHYSLSGASYGSMVASEAAGLAERGVAPKPDAVVLQGVVGHDLSDGQLFAGFQKQWARELEALPANVRDAVENDELLDADLSAQELGLFVVEQMLFRRYPSSDPKSKLEGPGRALTVLATGSSSQRQAARNWIKQIAAGARPDDAGVLAMYRAITCREITTEAWNTNSDVRMRLSKGKLEPLRADTCDGLTLDRAYDVKDWPTSAPTYYFVGLKDASTPPDQGEYHFAVQSGAERFYVEIPEAGHSALSSALTGCQIPIWQAIESGGGTLQDALKQCRFATRVKHAAAGERFIPPALP